MTVHFGAPVHRKRALWCTSTPKKCTVLLPGMAALDMPFRQSKIHSFCTVRKKLGKWLIEKYSLVIVHLEKTFSCVTTSKQYPARSIL